MILLKLLRRYYFIEKTARFWSHEGTLNLPLVAYDTHISEGEIFCLSFSQFFVRWWLAELLFSLVILILSLAGFVGWLPNGLNLLGHYLVFHWGHEYFVLNVNARITLANSLTWGNVSPSSWYPASHAELERTKRIIDSHSKYRNFIFCKLKKPQKT